MSETWEFELPKAGQAGSSSIEGEPSSPQFGPLAHTLETDPAGNGQAARQATAWNALNGREQAAAFLGVGRATEALALLQTWMDQHPEDVTGWCLVSQGLLFVREEFQALRAADLAIEADPYDTAGYAWKCRLALCRGWTQDALATVETGLEMTYQDPALRPWQIRTLVARGQRAQALQLLNSTSPARPDTDWAIAHGEVALDVGDLSTADASFQLAFRLNPKSVAAMLGMAAVFLARGQDVQAVNCLHHAVHLAAGGPEPARCVVEMLDAVVERDAPSLRPGALAVGLVVPQLSLWMLAGEHLNQQAARKRVRGLLPPDLLRYYHWHKAKDAASSVDLAGLLLRFGLTTLLPLILIVVVAQSHGWQAGARLAILVAIGKQVGPRMAERFRKVPTPPFLFNFPSQVTPRSHLPEAARRQDSEEQEGAEQEPGKALEGRIWRLLEQGDVVQARETAQERVALNPADEDAQTQLCMTALLMDRHREALMAARRVRSRLPDAPLGHALMWASLAAKGALDAAVKEADRASEFQEGAEALLIWLMGEMDRHASMDSAQAVSNLVERIYPYSGAPHRLRAERLMKKREWKAAEAAYRQGLSVEPDSAGLHAGLSWALAARHRYLAALREARQALSRNPNETSAHNSLLRHTQLLLITAPVVPCTVAGLIAALPTLTGARLNYGMVGISAIVPVVSGLSLGILVRPVVRRLAPGLLLRNELPCGTFGEGLRHYGVLGWTVASAACLSVQVLQCGLELLLHPGLLGTRWPGAVTVMACAAFAVWLTWARLSPYRWRAWWEPSL